jgi:hypothetical protein
MRVVGVRQPPIDDLGSIQRGVRGRIGSNEKHVRERDRVTPHGQFTGLEEHRVHSSDDLGQPGELGEDAIGFRMLSCGGARVEGLVRAEEPQIRGLGTPGPGAGRDRGTT